MRHATHILIAVAQEKIGGAIVDEEEELTEEAEDMIDNLFEAPLEKGELDDLKRCKHFQRLKQLTNDEYRKLKSWLDDNHAGWERHLGLENRRARGGGVQIVPTSGV